MNSKKLRVKDIITVTLLSLINIVIFSIGSFLYITPITIVLTPVVYGLLQGIVFFIIGTRVQKPGAIMIYCAIQGIVAFYLPYVLAYLLAGLAAELVLAKMGRGTSAGLTVSYIITQVFAGIGSTIYPYAVAIDSVTNNPSMENSEGLIENVRRAGEMLNIWGSLALIAGTAAAAFAGALIGRAVVKKHLAGHETDGGAEA